MCVFVISMLLVTQLEPSDIIVPVFCGQFAVSMVYKGMNRTFFGFDTAYTLLFRGCFTIINLSSTLVIYTFKVSEYVDGNFTLIWRMLMDVDKNGGWRWSKAKMGGSYGRGLRLLAVIDEDEYWWWQ